MAAAQKEGLLPRVRETDEGRNTMSEPTGPIKQGTWPDDCVQRAFVAGAEWQFQIKGGAMLRGERYRAEQEAVKRYGSPATADSSKPCLRCGMSVENIAPNFERCPACGHQWPGT